jgi:hypothetical protein
MSNEVNNNKKNVVIGLGNTGNNIVNEIAIRSTLNDVQLFAVDSVVANVTLANSNSRVNYIPIISDSKSGSGRNRERGYEMFKHHYEIGSFTEMLEACQNGKKPIFVVTSSAGGTGSGSTPLLCKLLRKSNIRVIPIIVCPSMDDPTAYHLNSNDLFMDLEESGVQTYAVFRNVAGDSNYTPINREIVDMLEIVLGKKYGPTTLDSIDDSDLNMMLKTPGRFVAVSAQATDIAGLTRQLARKIFTGFQPAWTDEDAKKYTFMTAYSLKSMFAGEDFKQVFDEVRSRIYEVFDEYRHIEQTDNNGVTEATVIISGLPRPEIKVIETQFNDVEGIGSGMRKSARPSFLSRRRKSGSSTSTTGEDGTAIGKFEWDD